MSTYAEFALFLWTYLVSWKDIFFLFWKKQLLKANKNLWENGLRNDLKKWHYIYKNKRGVRWKIEGEVY